MEIKHTNNQENGIFEAFNNGKRLGYLSYDWENDSVFAIMHTVVDPEYRGQGIAKSLLDAAVAFAREEGHKIRPVCPYVKRVFSQSYIYANANQEIMQLKTSTANDN